MTAAVTAPRAMEAGTGTPNCLLRIALAYAPTPIITTWPSDHSPVSVRKPVARRHENIDDQENEHFLLRVAERIRNEQQRDDAERGERDCYQAPFTHARGSRRNR